MLPKLTAIIVASQEKSTVILDNRVIGVLDIGYKEENPYTNYGDEVIELAKQFLQFSYLAHWSQLKIVVAKVVSNVTQFED